MEMRRFTDPIFPAFFEAHPEKDFTITPVKLPNERVAWDVSGENIDEALQELYENRMVGALDFIRALKSVRSSIWALRGGSRQ